MSRIFKAALLLAVAGAGFADAHTTFTNFFVDGAPMLDAQCVRMSHNIPNATSPLPSITGPEMACGVDGEMGVALVCPVNAGSIMTFEFRDWPDASHPGSIDPSHKGPCAVYMKKVDDASASNNAAGDGWFKIYQDDYDASSSQWCTEKLIPNNGHLSVQLPTDIEGGNYLVRSELLALQQADKTPADPQFYVGCAQVYLASNGSAVPKDTVSIPGYISMAANTAAMTFNIYDEPMALPYPMFGPPVYNSSLHFAQAAHPVLASSQTNGIQPAKCVLEMANWCGTELAAYSTENGCWDASAACWHQASACYDAAGPTGSKNCKIWESKCTAVQANCNAGDFQGPPDAGKMLTPAPPRVPLPPASRAPTTPSSVTTSVPAHFPVASTSTMAAVASATASSTANGGVTVAQSLTGSIDECGSRNSSAVCATSLCCSSHSYCGASTDYCGQGCQAGFGACS